jgi:hypothetical protein
MRAMSAVGPMVISLQLPNTTYTKQPTNAEYKPYCNKQTAMLSEVCLVPPNNSTTLLILSPIKTVHALPILYIENPF